MNLHTETSYVDELDYLHDEAYRDLQHEVSTWPTCDEGHPLAPDALDCEACTTEAREWASGLTPLQVRSALRMYEGEAGTVEYEPDELEAAWIADFEATRYQRWTALTTEEQDAVIDATEEEAGLRYDATQGRY